MPCGGYVYFAYTCICVRAWMGPRVPLSVCAMVARIRIDKVHLPLASSPPLRILFVSHALSVFEVVACNGVVPWCTSCRCLATCAKKGKAWAGLNLPGGGEGSGPEASHVVLPWRLCASANARSTTPLCSSSFPSLPPSLARACMSGDRLCGCYLEAVPAHPKERGCGGPLCQPRMRMRGQETRNKWSRMTGSCLAAQRIHCTTRMTSVNLHT